MAGTVHGKVGKKTTQQGEIRKGYENRQDRRFLSVHAGVCYEKTKEYSFSRPKKDVNCLQLNDAQIIPTLAPGFVRKPELGTCSSTWAYYYVEIL